MAALACACGTPEHTVRSANGEIAVLRVVAPAPAVVGSPAEATMAVYATILNRGTTADTIVGVESAAARAVGIHLKSMAQASAIPVAAGEVMVLEPGGAHVMLEGLSRQFVAGDTLAFALVFRRAGRVELQARVVPYDQLERALAR